MTGGRDEKKIHTRQPGDFNLSTNSRSGRKRFWQLMLHWKEVIS